MVRSTFNLKKNEKLEEKFKEKFEKDKKWELRNWFEFLLYIEKEGARKGKERPLVSCTFLFS